MTCSCINAYDGDISEFDHITVARSRKHRTCCECDCKINPGDQYEHVWGKWDGRTSTYDTCIVCVEVRDALMCTWCYGEIWETLRDAWWDDPETIPWSTIGELSPVARERVCESIEAPWADMEESA